MSRVVTYRMAAALIENHSVRGTTISAKLTLLELFLIHVPLRIVGPLQTPQHFLEFCFGRHRVVALLFVVVVPAYTLLFEQAHRRCFFEVGQLSGASFEEMKMLQESRAIM